MHFDTFDELYTHLVRDGVRAKPRGLYVRQDHDVVFHVRRHGYYVERAGINNAIGAMEGLQFIAGVFDKKSIECVAPKANLDLFTLQAAYGPRVSKSLASLIVQLLSDSDSRRAIMMIASPLDTPETLPCTISFQAHMPNSMLLNATVYMRSSDIVWGLPYDLIQFQMMQEAIAMCVGAEPGELTIFIGNSHVYESTGMLNNGQRKYTYVEKVTSKFIPAQFSDLHSIRAYCRGLIDGTSSAQSLMRDLGWGIHEQS